MGDKDSLVVNLFNQVDSLTSDSDEKIGGDVAEKITQNIDMTPLVGTGMWGKTEQFMDPDLLMAEAEEYMMTGKTLGEGLSPVDWGKENLDFGGWDWWEGYHKKAQDFSQAAPGFDNYSKEVGTGGYADKYFYNLALTQAYQQMSDSIIKGKQLSQIDVNRALNIDIPASSYHTGAALGGRGIGSFSGEPFEKPGSGKAPTQGGWQDYQGLISAYTTPDARAQVQKDAAIKAADWAGQYRKSLKGKFTSFVGEFKKADMSDKTGRILSAVDDMINRTETINSYADTIQALNNVGEKDASEGATAIVDTLSKIEKQNIKTDTSDIQKNFTGDQSQIDIINATMQTIQNQISDEQGRIKRSKAGEDEYWFTERGGQHRSAGKITDLGGELGRLQEERDALTSKKKR